MTHCKNVNRILGFLRNRSFLTRENPVACSRNFFSLPRTDFYFYILEKCTLLRSGNFVHSWELTKILEEFQAGKGEYPGKLRTGKRYTNSRLQRSFDKSGQEKGSARRSLFNNIPRLGSEKDSLGEYLHFVSVWKWEGWSNLLYVSEILNNCAW
jgi:hypothetical protein